jgi:lysozyme
MKHWTTFLSSLRTFLENLNFLHAFLTLVIWLYVKLKDRLGKTENGSETQMDLSLDAKAQLISMLKVEEGYRQFLYHDTEGKLSGGNGHNFTDNGVSIAVSNFMLEEDIDYFIKTLPTTFSWYNGLSDNRKIVVLDMCFNLGLKKFQTFHNMIQHLFDGDYADAADEMMNSIWAKQVGERAVKLAEIMRTNMI